MDKAELLAKTRASWDVLNAYIATLNEEQLTQRTDAAGWSVKDHLIHLSVWEDGIWALLNKRDRATEMGVDAESWKRWNFEEINGVIQRQHKDLSWAQAQQRRQIGHKRFIEQIEATSEVDLLRPIKDFQTTSTGKTPVIEVIVGDAFSHYDTHLPWIKAIVQNGTS